MRRLFPIRRQADARERRLVCLQGGEGPRGPESTPETQRESKEAQEKQRSAPEEAGRRVEAIRGDVRSLREGMVREYGRHRERLEELEREGVNPEQVRKLRAGLRRLREELAAEGVGPEQLGITDADGSSQRSAEQAAKFLKGTIRIEYTPGMTRNGNRVVHPYGYILGATGGDGEALDVFLGPDPESQNVFIIDQIPQDIAGDGGAGSRHISDREQKCMVGFRTQEEAVAAYLQNYPPGWKPGPVTAVTAQDFTARLERGRAGPGNTADTLQKAA